MAEVVFVEVVLNADTPVTEKSGVAIAKFMKPEQLAKTTEHSHQMAFFAWCQQQSKGAYPKLKFAFAIPNGGARDTITASKLKAEGVKKGVADVFIPISAHGMHGLWIEFKRPGTETQSEGKLSTEQKEFRDFVLSEKYGHFVAYSYSQAVDCVVQYLS